MAYTRENPSARYRALLAQYARMHAEGETPEEDLPWIVDEIFGCAMLFVYLNVACFPARHLPSGEWHVTFARNAEAVAFHRALGAGPLNKELREYAETRVKALE